MKNSHWPFYAVFIGLSVFLAFVVLDKPASDAAQPSATITATPVPAAAPAAPEMAYSSLASEVSIDLPEKDLADAERVAEPVSQYESQRIIVMEQVAGEGDGGGGGYSDGPDIQTFVSNSASSPGSPGSAGSPNSGGGNSASSPASGGGSSGGGGTAGGTDSDDGGSGGGLGGLNRPDCKAVVLSSCERVLQDEYAVNGQSFAEIDCAKNETESFQIMVCNASGSVLPDIEIHVSSFEPQGRADRMPVMTLYREHYVEVKSPSWGLPADNPIGWYPNALIPFVDPYTNRPITSAKYLANHQSVAPKTSQGYWADIKVNASVPAGQYTCSVLVTSAGVPVGQIPVTFNVWNFTLPAKRAWTAWFSMLNNIGLIHGLPKNEGTDYDLLLSRYQDMQYDHGIYPTFQKWPWFDKEGNVHFNDGCDKALKAFVNKYGPGVLWIPFAVIKDKFDKNGNNPVGAQILADYHNYSLAHRELGQFMYYMDEPYKTIEEAHQVINISRLINDNSLSSIKMFTNGDVYKDMYKDKYFGSGYNPGGNPAFADYENLAKQVEAASDIRSFYCRTQMQPYTTPLSLEAAMQKTINDGRAVWICQMSKLDNNLLMNRMGTWRGYVVGATGQLEWRVIPSDAALDPWVDPVNARAPAPQTHIWNGYDQYLYPGTSARVGISGPGCPIASMMLKVFRDSVDDYAYFKLAESLVNRQAVVEMVEPAAPDFTTHKAATEYAAVRKAIAELILSKMN